MSTKSNINDKKHGNPNPSPSNIGLGRPDASAPQPPASPTLTLPHPRAIVLDGHVANAMVAAAEIEASASFAHDFGKCAPDATSIVEFLRVAHAWSEEQTRAEVWRDYAFHQREQAWSSVMTALAPLVAGFAGAVLRDPSIAARYPALTAFVSVRKANARRGAATRKRHADARARQRKAVTPAAPAATEAPSPPPTLGTVSAA